MSDKPKDYKGAKLLILGEKNTGKSTLTKPIENSLTISYDAKMFPFEKPHVQLGDNFTVDELKDEIIDGVHRYYNKMQKYPDTIIIDAISRIFGELEDVCANRFKGYDIYGTLLKWTNSLVKFINSELLGNGFNVILVGHTTFDSDSKTFKEVLSGKFKDTGFISTTDECIYTEFKGSKYIVHHRKHELARTFQEDLPDKQEADKLDIVVYFNKLIEKQENMAKNKWSI